MVVTVPEGGYRERLYSPEDSTGSSVWVSQAGRDPAAEPIVDIVTQAHLDPLGVNGLHATHGVLPENAARA